MLLGLLYQGNNVSHAKDPVCHTLRVEDVQGLKLFSGRDKLDGLSYHGLDGKGCTASGVTVHLGEDHTVKVQAVVEHPCGFHGILTCHCIHHKEGFSRVQGLVEGRYLIHQLIIHGKAAGGIHNHYGEAFCLGFLHSLLGNPDGILLPFNCENGNLNAISQHFQLLDGGWTEGVAGCKKDFHSLLGLEVKGKLCAEGSLTGTVETGNQNNAGISLNVDLLGR